MPFDKTKNQRKGFCFITFESEQIVNELLKTPKQTINGKEVSYCSSSSLFPATCFDVMILNIASFAIEQFVTRELGLKLATNKINDEVRCEYVLSVCWLLQVDVKKATPKPDGMAGMRGSRGGRGMARGGRGGRGGYGGQNWGNQGYGGYGGYGQGYGGGYDGYGGGYDYYGGGYGGYGGYDYSNYGNYGKYSNRH